MIFFSVLFGLCCWDAKRVEI